MSDSTDPELARLLDAYGQAAKGLGIRAAWGRGTAAALDIREETRAAVDAYLASRYVRRDRLIPDEWDNLDATAVVDLAGPGFDGPIPDDPPDTVPAGYRAARGAVPWRPGMPTPEEAIRRLRDGEVSTDGG